MASLLSLIILFLALIAAITAAALPAFQVPGINLFEPNDGPVIEKRVPHPSWRSNVRINHIQHHDGSPHFNNYENGQARSFYNQWAFRPFQQY
uniref:Uncharacterized protein n=1 Tax=Panagrolaimus superbus TaxID=310955 RepID=A0A914YB56_9BILA